MPPFTTTLYAEKVAKCTCVVMKNRSRFGPPDDDETALAGPTAEQVQMQQQRAAQMARQQAAAAAADAEEAVQLAEAQRTRDEILSVLVDNLVEMGLIAPEPSDDGTADGGNGAGSQAGNDGDAENGN